MPAMNGPLPPGQPRRMLDALRERWRAFAHQHPDAVRYGALTAAVIFVLICGVTGYYYVTFSRMIDARLHGEADIGWILTSEAHFRLRIRTQACSV